MAPSPVARSNPVAGSGTVAVGAVTSKRFVKFVTPAVPERPPSIVRSSKMLRKPFATNGVESLAWLSLAVANVIIVLLVPGHPIGTPPTKEPPTQMSSTVVTAESPVAVAPVIESRAMLKPTALAVYEKNDSKSCPVFAVWLTVKRKPSDDPPLVGVT